MPSTTTAFQKVIDVRITYRYDFMKPKSQFDRWLLPKREVPPPASLAVALMWPHNKPFIELHWHQLTTTRKVRFFSADPAHCKFTCLPVLVRGWTGEGRKLTQTGVCDLLGSITEWSTLLLNRLNWIGKDPCTDICLEFTTLYYWAIILIPLSVARFAGFNFNTAGLTTW